METPNFFFKAPPAYFSTNLILAVDLPRVGDEFLAVVGESNAASAAVKDRYADLLFQFTDGAAERGLRHIQYLRRLVKRAGFRYDYRVMKLLQCHFDHPLPVAYYTYRLNMFIITL